MSDEQPTAATNGPVDDAAELMFERWWRRRFGRFADSQPGELKALCFEAYTADPEFIPAPQTYDQVTAAYMAQWSTIVPLEERARLLDVVNQFALLPDASRRVAAAVICAIELVSRPELIPAADEYDEHLLEALRHA